jgi:GDP-4-dehydro-6-deoxy-D-mannose reductase
MAAARSGEDRAPGLKVAITGAHGFVGRHLVQALRDSQPHWTLDTPEGPQTVGGLDVVDADAVEAWIAVSRPDVVVHLAAVAAVTVGLADPRFAWKVNLDGTLNLVLALQRRQPDADLVFISSAEVYGASFLNAASLDERALLQPVNPYAASKAAADLLVRQAAADGLAATVMRPFNHTGPGQDEAFVAPSFAGQIARIEAGLQPPVIDVGSLDEERDFLDVADVVQAYRLAIERRRDPAMSGVFNVASGQPVRIGDLLDRLLSQAKRKIDVRVDPARLRKAPIPRVVGDASRLRSLGWRPTRNLDDTLRAVLEERRSVVARTAGGR